MADYTVLSAVPRTILGKKVKRLRREGKLPAVIYGPVIEGAKSITVDGREFEFAYREVGMTSLVDLQVEGESHTVFVREVQTNPVRNDILHIDFYAPNMMEPIDTTIPIFLTGEFEAEEADIEVIQFRQDLDITSLPNLVPNQIDVDISGLHAHGEAIHVSELTLPEGVTATTEPEEVVARVDYIQVEEEPEEGEEALAEETGAEPELVGGEGNEDEESGS